MEFVLLLIFAFFAGFIDSMAGGGGLIQLPALFILQPHLTLAQTLATNKLSSVCGTSIATRQYLKHIQIDWKLMRVGVLLAFVGSFFGAMAASYFHKDAFTPVIIGALLLVFIYTLFNKQSGLHPGKDPGTTAAFWMIGIIGAGIGFYDGMIGPGTGSFLIFLFVTLFGMDFLHASANSKIINLTTNIAALVFFIPSGNVAWKVAMPLAVANVAGSLIGSKLALKKGSAFVRIIFIIVVSALILKLCWDHFGK
jgi:uncharacterized membrane protein YfcA